MYGYKGDKQGALPVIQDMVNYDLSKGNIDLVASIDEEKYGTIYVLVGLKKVTLC